MPDCYKIKIEAFEKIKEKANKYDCLISRIKKGIKKYRTLAQTTKNEDYRLAYSMLADYLEEIKKQR